MSEDKISEAKSAIRTIHRKRVQRIVLFVSLLIVLGLLGEYIAPRIPGLTDNFSWGFLTEMLGAAVTLLIIEVAFQRSEENNIKGIQAWLDAAAVEKTAALEARRQAEEALAQLQQTMNSMHEELQSAQKMADEYKSIAMQTQIDNLNKVMSGFTHALDEYRLRTDPRYALEKMGQTLLSVQNQMWKLPYVRQNPVRDQDKSVDQSSEDESL